MPQGAVEGEWASDVQPFSVCLPRVAGDEEITERDMWGISPLDQLWCRIQYHRLRYEGMYTPPSHEGTVFNPGFNGGVDWGGVAVDPERNLLIVNNNNLPNIVTLFPRDEADEREDVQGSAMTFRAKAVSIRSTACPMGPARSPGERSFGCPARGHPGAISVRSILRRGSSCGASPWERGEIMDRGVFPPCCRSPSARRTMEVRWSPREVLPSSPPPWTR